MPGGIRSLHSRPYFFFFYDIIRVVDGVRTSRVCGPVGLSMLVLVVLVSFNNINIIIPLCALCLVQLVPWSAPCGRVCVTL